MMKYKLIAALAGVSIFVAATTVAEAGNRNRTWCRHLQNSDSPMTWSEGYGVSSCNDRAATPYRPWRSAEPIRRNQSDYHLWRGGSTLLGELKAREALGLLIRTWE